MRGVRLGGGERRGRGSKEWFVERREGGETERGFKIEEGKEMWLGMEVTGSMQTCETKEAKMRVGGHNRRTREGLGRCVKSHLSTVQQ